MKLDALPVIEEYYERIDQLQEPARTNRPRRSRYANLLPGARTQTCNDSSTASSNPNHKKQGRPTTDHKALEKMAALSVARPIVNHLLTMREIAKKIDFLKTGVDRDGRIRTSYNISGTSTDALVPSYSEFALAEITKRVEEVLECFHQRSGWKFAKFDAKSGESYCVGAIEGNLFNDWRYLDAVESGDVHTTVASNVLA